MNIIYAIVLGLIQGLTEFLPVSSSGHLVLLNKLFGSTENFTLLAVLLHLATLFAVFIVLRKEIVFLFKNPFSREAKLLYVATIPTIVIVLLFKTFFESSFEGDFLIPCFLATAVVLIFTDFYKPKNRKEKEFSFKSALLMGVSQGIAVLPGISRSGATICTGVVAGEKREDVAKFSFLMSVPIIICSLAYELYNGIAAGENLLTVPVLEIIIAFITAFIVGVFAIKIMIWFVKKSRYFYFGIYLILLSIILIILKTNNII